MRNKQYRLSRPVTKVVGTPWLDDGSEPLPCWRCGKNDAPLVGRITTALVIDNVLTEVEGKQYWMPRLVPTYDEDGRPGDNEPGYKEAVLNKQNYHRECENAYQRQRRGAKSAKTTKMIEQLQQSVAGLKIEIEKLRQQPAPQPTVIVQNTNPPGRPPGQQPQTQQRGMIDSNGRYVKMPFNTNVDNYPINKAPGAGSDARTREIFGVAPDPVARMRAIIQERIDMTREVESGILDPEVATLRLGELLQEENDIKRQLDAARRYMQSTSSSQTEEDKT